MSSVTASVKSNRTKKIKKEFDLFKTSIDLHSQNNVGCKHFYWNDEPAQQCQQLSDEHYF